MKKHNGGIAGFLISLIVIVLLGASAFLCVEYIRKRSYAQGNEALEEHKYAEAEELFEKTLKYSLRKGADVYAKLGIAQLGKGDRNNAKLNFEQALKNDAENVESRFELGKMFIEENNFGEAREKINELEKIGNDSALAAASELKSMLKNGAAKGMFNEFMNNLIPNVSDTLKNFLPKLKSPKEKEQTEGDIEFKQEEEMSETEENEKDN